MYITRENRLLQLDATAAAALISAKIARVVRREAPFL